MERVAELVRLGGLLALPAPTGPVHAVTAERVALEPREEVVEDLLADPPAAPRRELQPLPVAREVAGLLESAGQVIERVEVADRLVAQQVAHLVAVDVGEIARTLDVGEGVLHAVHRREPFDLGQGAFESERLVAAERDALTKAAGQEQVQVRRELGEVDQQPVVAQERLHHRFELGPLLRRHRPQEGLHRGHARGELVDDVVEALGAGEEAAVLRQELADVRVAAADPLPDELVEVADHLAVRGEVLRAHGADRVRHARDVLVEHLATELADEVVVALAGLGLEEVVVAETAQPLPDVRGETVELVEPLGGDVAQHLAQVGVVRSLGRGLLQPPFHPGALLGHDLVELATDVAEDVAEPVAFESLLAPTLEAVHQVAQAGEVRPRRDRPCASRAP